MRVIFKHHLLYLIPLIFAFACSPVQLIYSDKTARQEMDNYQSFAFARLEERVKVSRSNSESTETYVREEVIRQMERKGYRYDEDNPELLLDLEVILVDFQQEQGSQSRYISRRDYYYANPYGYRYGYGPVNQPESDPSMKAVISLTLAGASGRQLLGEGGVEARLGNKPEKSSRNLNEAVRLLLANLIGGE